MRSPSTTHRAKAYNPAMALARGRRPRLFGVSLAIPLFVGLSLGLGSAGCTHYLSAECRDAMNQCLARCAEGEGNRTSYPPLAGVSGRDLRDNRTPCQRDCETPQRFAQCR